MIQYIFSFITGGVLTTTVVYLQLNGFPWISRIALLFPTFTWLSYLFIGSLESTKEVAKSVHFILIGTLVTWIPYMLVIYFYVEKWGVIKALVSAILLFIILAILFSFLYDLPA